MFNSEQHKKKGVQKRTQEEQTQTQTIEKQNKTNILIIKVKQT